MAVVAFQDRAEIWPLLLTKVPYIIIIIIIIVFFIIIIIII